MASPVTRQQQARSIPIRRIRLSDSSELPADYSSTPGGTLYSTTPGGTKIVYDRSVLLHLRNSPISKTPPKWDIPEGLLKGSPNNGRVFKRLTSPIKVTHIEDEQFPLEM